MVINNKWFFIDSPLITLEISIQFSNFIVFVFKYNTKNLTNPLSTQRFEAKFRHNV